MCDPVCLRFIYASLDDFEMFVKDTETFTQLDLTIPGLYNNSENGPVNLR